MIAALCICPMIKRKNHAQNHSLVKWNNQIFEVMPPESTPWFANLVLVSWCSNWVFENVENSVKTHEGFIFVVLISGVCMIISSCISSFLNFSIAV